MAERRGMSLRQYLTGGQREQQQQSQDRGANTPVLQYGAGFGRQNTQEDFRERGYLFERHQRDQFLSFEHGYGGFGDVEGEPWSHDLWEGF